MSFPPTHWRYSKSPAFAGWHPYFCSFTRIENCHPLSFTFCLNHPPPFAFCLEAILPWWIFSQEGKQKTACRSIHDLSKYVNTLTMFICVCVCVCMCVCVVKFESAFQNSDSPVILYNKSTETSVKKTLQISYEISFRRCNCAI